MLVLVLTAFVVLQPDGWVEDRDLAAKAFPADRIETRAFHAPGDPETIFIAARGAGPAPYGVTPELARIADDTAAATQKLGATIANRTHVVDRGRTIDEVLLDLPNGQRMHMRVTFGAIDNRYEVLVGMCRGRGALLAACDARLADLVVPVDYVRHVLYAIGSGLVGLVVVVLAIRWWLRRRDLARSAPLVDGELATIAGVVRAIGPSLEAPLSGRACVLHRSHARFFSAAQPPQLVGEPCELESRPFIVDTKFGPIEIDASAPEIPITPSMVVDLAVPRLLAFRARHDVAPDLKAIFDEIVIEPGAKVTIRGLVRIERDAGAAVERGYRDDAPTTTRLVAPPSQPLAILRVW